MPADLTDREAAVLAFERRWWRLAGTREVAMRAELGLDAAGYFAELNRVLDLPGALDADPLLVRRLRRQRSSRQQSRSAARRTVAG